jgi:glycosyltransferase involved in cell wall biosynthesis
MAASFSGSTSAGGLEDMTLSMIRGDDPVFLRQIETLLAWIREHERPDVILLSSSLVIGIGKVLKEETKLPIVCSLQDEEIWIDGLENAFAEAAWTSIADNMKYIDRFITTSEFYKKFALRRFPQIGQIDVVYPGLDTSLYASTHYPAQPTIGFFYRMNELNGLHILAEAFVKVKQSGRIPGLRLRIGGGYTSSDKSFLRKLRRMLAPYSEDVTWCETYRLQDHAAFYREISALCVPLTFEEGVGLYLCEAFAAGRPAIEPDAGSFAEITDGAGLLYSPNTPDALAAAIERLFTTEGLWESCRDRALHLAKSRYHETVQAAALCEILNHPSTP